MTLGSSSIRRPILAGFAVVLALLVVQLGVGLRGLGRIRDLRQDIVEKLDPPSHAADRLEHGVLYRAIALRNYVASGDERHLDEYERQLADQWDTLAELARMDLDREGAAARDALAPAAREHVRASAAFLALVGKRAAGGELAREEARLSQARRRFLSAIHAFDGVQRRLQSEARARMAVEEQDVRRTLVTVAALVALALAVTAGVTTRAVRRPALTLVEAARALERGDYAPALSLSPPGHAAGEGELAVLGAAFGRMADALQRRELRMGAEGRLGAALATPLDAEATARSALHEVVAYTRADLAAVYVAEGDGLRRIAGHAAEGSPAALPLRGIVAEALSTGAPVGVADVPEDVPFSLHLGFGVVRPRSVLAVPLSARGERVGLLLLGALAPLGADAASFAERAAGHLAIALQNAVTHERVGAFAEQLRDRSERLQVQNEELQARREEIQAQRDEIRQHNEALAAAKEALSAKAAALEQVDRRKNEFLATLGHELRNPLAAVATAGRLLEAAARDGAAARHATIRHASVVSRQVQHLRRLVDDLLDLSRIDHGKIELRPERVDLVAALDAGVQGILPDAIARGQRVSFRGGHEPLMVDGDPVRLEQIVSNLLRNAVKYTTAGGTITVGVGAEGGDAVIRVDDTGIGIAPELLPRIFEPFVQGTHSAGAEQGLGLGLALARRLVELHGGSVEARSGGADAGAVFLVRLPLAPPAPAAPAPIDERPPPPDRDGRSLRVLLVEDNPDVAETTAEALELFGYAVRVELDADSGLRAALEAPPDVALLDIGLGEKSGYDLARDIRARLPSTGIRLVAVTGYGQPEDRLRSAEAGFDHHLVKPVNPEELRDVIERLVAGRPLVAA